MTAKEDEEDGRERELTKEGRKTNNKELKMRNRR